MNNFTKLLGFLKNLEKESIHYSLSNIRENSICVEVVVPGERWEVEFIDDNTIEIEKFISNGNIFDEKELKVLFEKFSD